MVAIMSLPAKKNIFMIGLNEFNRRKLNSLRNFDEYEFHGLIPPEEAEDADHYDVEAMIGDLTSKLDAATGPIDAIVTYIDFPVSLLTPVLCKKFNRPSASLESVMKCHHKYWSRVEQAKVIGDHIPKFSKINPFDHDPLKEGELGFPFWLKPVKSVGSYLGFRVENKRQFRQYLEIIRGQINRMAEPFNYILSLVELPEEIQGVDGNYCIAEQLIGGHQCTVEGYVLNGEICFHGIIDSIRHPNRSTFLRYEYPSQLPKKVQERMAGICRKILTHIDYNNAAFNIEFFWNKPKDKIWLLEINTRVSQSHSDLFEKVDGASNHAITVNVGLGRSPDFPHRQGPYKRASKFFYRSFRDAVVSRVPTTEEIKEIEKTIDGVLIDVKVTEGMRLSDLNEQDSYSYELAWIFIGGKDHENLTRKYRECVDRLNFAFKPIEDSLPIGVVPGTGVFHDIPPEVRPL